MLEIKPCIALHFVEIVSQQHNCKQTVNGTEQSTHTSQIIQNLGIKGASAWYPNCLVWAHLLFCIRFLFWNNPCIYQRLGTRRTLKEYSGTALALACNSSGFGVSLLCVSPSPCRCHPRPPKQNPKPLHCCWCGSRPRCGTMATSYRWLGSVPKWLALFHWNDGGRPVVPCSISVHS